VTSAVPGWASRRTATFLSFAALLAIVWGLHGPIRVGAVLAFVLLAPGTTIMRLFLPSIAAGVGPRLLLAVVMSAALCVVLAQAMVLLRFWHPTAAVGVLASATAIVNLAPRLRSRRRR
jgi:hypothetical protein